MVRRSISFGARLVGSVTGVLLNFFGAWQMEAGSKPLDLEPWMFVVVGTVVAVVGLVSEVLVRWAEIARLRDEIPDLHVGDLVSKTEQIDGVEATVRRVPVENRKPGTSAVGTQVVVTTDPILPGLTDVPAPVHLAGNHERPWVTEHTVINGLPLWFEVASYEDSDGMASIWLGKDRYQRDETGPSFPIVNSDGKPTFRFTNGEVMTFNIRAVSGNGKNASGREFVMARVPGSARLVFVPKPE